MPGIERVAPQAIESTVLDVVEELVGELRGTGARTTVTLDASIDRDLGLGSLERVELGVRLEQVFGVLLPDAILEEAETPRAIASAVTSAGSSGRPVVREPLAPPAPGTPAPASLRTLADVLRWQAESARGACTSTSRSPTGVSDRSPMDSSARGCWRSPAASTRAGSGEGTRSGSCSGPRRTSSLPSSARSSPAACPFRSILRPASIGSRSMQSATPVKPKDGGWKEMVRLRDATYADIARRL